MDLTIIGSGPAGVSAAVSASSEGLHTVLLDAIGVGGRAPATPRVMNHLGFPFGISGFDLTQRGAQQARNLGVRLSGRSQVTAVDARSGHLRVTTDDGVGIDTRAILIATGARYRRLPLPRWSTFEAAGIYYAVTEIEVRSCTGEPVTVLGEANPAGLAALYLAARGNPVTLVASGPDLRSHMSANLVDRLIAEPHVTLHTSTQITALLGGERLEAIHLRDSAGREELSRPCRGLFCLLGADAATSWSHGVSVDHNGFIRTGTDVDSDRAGLTWSILGRAPLLFETSTPTIFAAGDVRAGSIRQVAAAVAEGISAVQSVHIAIGL